MTAPRLDRELSGIYARALLAIARGDGEITSEEARRLQRQIDERCAWPIAIDDLLLDAPLSTQHLTELALGNSTPFRSAAIDRRALAKLLVTDGIAVVLEKGHIADGEASKLRAFASALGLSDAEFSHLTAHAARWLPRE
jgi:hypothetical protein